MSQQPNILVVEDETSIASFVAAYLRNAGYTVRTSSTAQAALTEIASEAPSLVVLDLNLPDGDGVELCRRIRKSSDVPILMLTTEGQPEAMARAKKCGAKGWIVKPFKEHLLLGAVQKLTQSGP